MSRRACKYFTASGVCPFGAGCTFVHAHDGVSSSAEGDPAALAGSRPACRNIALYGFCRFAGRGCEFSHDSAAVAAGSSAGIQSGAGSNSQQPLFGGGMERPSSAPPTKASSGGLPLSLSLSSAGRAGSAGAASAQVPVQQQMQPGQYLPQQQQQPNTPSEAALQALQHPPVLHVHPGNGLGASVAPPTILRHPRTPIAPGSRAGRRSFASFFVREDVRSELTRRHVLACSHLPIEQMQELGLPSNVHTYYNLVPLDGPSRSRPPAALPSVFGYPSRVFKCTNSDDGLAYAIRRIESYKPSNQQALKLGELWMQVKSPSIVPLSALFVSKDFGDTNSLFFVSPYYPGAETLEQHYFRGSPGADLLPEAVLWSFLTQMLSALKILHHEGFACRVLVPSKILVTGTNRFRVSGAGIIDVLNFDGNKPPAVNQHEDLLMLGKLLLLLATRSLGAVQQLGKSMELLQSRYSEDLKNLIVFLLTKPSGLRLPTVDDVAAMIAPRLLTECDQAHAAADSLEADLSTELENGRMFRLLCKLGFVNERPEFEGQAAWSETGDRYLLKLFRDYVFHQTYEDGAPVVDLAHVTDCLNKLDTASDEKIMLMSRDEQSLLIVSFRDLNRCVGQVFNELLHGSTSYAGSGGFGGNFSS